MLLCRSRSRTARGRSRMRCRWRGRSWLNGECRTLSILRRSFHYSTVRSYIDTVVDAVEVTEVRMDTMSPHPLPAPAASKAHPNGTVLGVTLAAIGTSSSRAPSPIRAFACWHQRRPARRVRRDTLTSSLSLPPYGRRRHDGYFGPRVDRPESVTTVVFLSLPAGCAIWPLGLSAGAHPSLAPSSRPRSRSVALPSPPGSRCLGMDPGWGRPLLFVAGPPWSCSPPRQISHL